MNIARGLMPKEIELFPADFLKQIDINAIQLISRPHNIFAKNKILVRPNKIYWPNCPSDFTEETVHTQSILMHELCHVWQYQTRRLSALRYLLIPKNWIYNYVLDVAKKFDDYPIEKQADLMQDWYLANKGYPPCRFKKDSCETPTKSAIDNMTPFIWN
jgi:hypothetical protein